MNKKQPLSLKYLSAICFKHHHYCKIMQLENKMSQLYPNDIIKSTAVVNERVEQHRQLMRPFLPEHIREYLNGKKRCCIYKCYYIKHLRAFYKKPNRLVEMEIKKVCCEDAERFNHKECLEFFKPSREQNIAEIMCQMSINICRISGGALGFPT
jgi:hypothetical protein